MYRVEDDSIIIEISACRILCDSEQPYSLETWSRVCDKYHEILKRDGVYQNLAENEGRHPL